MSRVKNTAQFRPLNSEGFVPVAGVALSILAVLSIISIILPAIASGAP
jgi:hypothetical protein